jgi:putative ABC transport system ATP-binding protein
MPILQAEDLIKHYRMGSETVRALDGVSMVVHRGESLAVMGPSGSGKSTLLNILGCLDLPTSGKYRLAGDDVAGLSQSALAEIRGRRIGFVFQTFELLPRTTALKNVEIPLIYARTRNRRQRAMEALERVGLADRMHHRPNELSGGQRQRVAIARALAQRPDILLADEPTGNLDSKTGREILDFMFSLNREGQTVVLITHDPSVGNRCRRILHLRDGRIAGEETVAHPALQEVADAYTAKPH